MREAVAHSHVTPAESLEIEAAGDVSYGVPLSTKTMMACTKRGQGDSKVKTGLVLDKPGPLNGITLDGKVSLKRESQ